MFIQFASYDRPIGVAILSITGTAIVYLSLWIILVPLLNEDHIIPAHFPKISSQVLLGIPVLIGTLFFTFLGLTSLYYLRLGRDHRLRTWSSRNAKVSLD